MSAPRKWYPVVAPGEDFFRPERMVVLADDEDGAGEPLAAVPPAEADRLCAEHNALVDEHRQFVAERPTVGDLEGFLSRVLAEAIREVLHHPFRRAAARRRAKRVSPAGDKAVHVGEEIR